MLKYEPALVHSRRLARRDARLERQLGQGPGRDEEVSADRPERRRGKPRPAV